MGGFRSVCFFAFLFVICKAQDPVSSEDLKSGPAISEEDESKSGAHAESFANSDGGYAKGESYADTNSGSSLAQSSASSGGYGSSSAQASAQSNVGSEQYINQNGLKELSLLGSGLQGSSSSKAQAETVAITNGINNLYPELKPGVQLSPYDSGSSSHALAESQYQTNNGGYYYNPYYHDLLPNYNSGSTTSQAESQASSNIYEGSQEYMYMNPSYQGNQYPLNFYSLPSPAKTQAESQLVSSANINNYNSGFGTYIPSKSLGLNPYQKGYLGQIKQNSAQTSAEAQSVLNAGGGGYNQGVNGYQQNVLNPGLSLSQAEAQALTDMNNYNFGLNPYVSNPGFLKPNSAQVSAEALINGFGGGYIAGLTPYRPGYIPEISGSLQTEAQSFTNNGGDSYGSGIYPKNKPYLYQYGSNFAQTHAEALSNDYGNAGGLPYGQEQNVQAQAETFSGVYENTGGLSYGQGQHTPSSAEAQAIASGQGPAIANAQAQSGGASGYSRLISSHEYIMPDVIPGIETAIVCTSKGEMYNVWSPVNGCLVCACITQIGILAPLCTRCDGCKEQLLEPVILPEWESIVITPSPPMHNVSEITCSPLPSWQSFENPLNPCQVCVCKEILNNYGTMEAEIDCVANPDCVLPPDTLLLPPIPDEHPIPLPVCEKFPQNVHFPHPADECKLCKCDEEMTQDGLLEPRITCVPNPECVSEIVTVPTAIPYEDLNIHETLLPIPVEPVPFPDVIVTPDPLPWPPVTTGPGPLPGSSPHESCRPFQPGQTFQHPWDECQMCVCTEARDLGLITIEVNCFTKKSCCYESANEPATTASSSIQIIDKLCEFKTFGVEFVHPQDKCKVCTCELFGGVVKSSCKLAQKSECLLSYIPGISSEVTETQENSDTSYQPSMYSPLLPGQNSMYDAKAQIQRGYPGGHQPSELYNMGISNFQTKTREKLIQHPLLSEPLSFNKYSEYSNPDLIGLSGYQPQQGYQGDLIRPVYQNIDGSISSEALVNSYLDANEYQKSLKLPGYHQYNQFLGYPVTGSAAAQAEASLSGFDQQAYYPGYQVSDPFSTGAEGKKNLLTGYNKLYYTGSVPNEGNSLTIKGSGQASGSDIGTFYQAIPASNIYPILYPRPSFETTSLYYPGQFGLADSSALGQSLAQGLGSAANALANVAEINTKSGEEGLEIEITEKSK